MRDSTKYLVLERHEDRPQTSLLTTFEVIKRMEDGDWDGYDFLETLPNLLMFPSRSVFIFKGKVVKEDLQ